jgi:hypothetical protein
MPLSDRARQIAGAVFHDRSTLRLLNQNNTISEADREAIKELEREGYVVFLGEDPVYPGSEMWRGRARCNDHREYALKQRGGLELVTIERERAKEESPSSDGGAERE